MESARSTSALIEKYCARHSSPPPILLQELERETHLKTLSPQMITGHLQGRLLSLVSQMINPSRVLEIGTFTGYGALCLAEGLTHDGILHTIESNDVYDHIARSYVDRSPYQYQIVLHHGDALMIIPTLSDVYDLVYLDGSKKEYQAYFQMIFPSVRPGGIILADNLLWSGKVLDDNRDGDSEALRDFAEMISQDMRVDQLLLPVRDGLLICRKTM